VTAVHIFLKMLEHFCQKGQRHLVVQKVKKAKRQKTKKRKGKIRSCAYEAAETLVIARDQIHNGI